MQKFDVNALGLTLGIIWGAAILLVGLSAAFFGYGAAFVELASTLYIGYAPTILGAIIGTVWAFIDAYVGGVVIAWLYNKLTNNQQPTTPNEPPPTFHQ